MIALTFCCGFLVVFASLRLAASVHGLHQAMPVMAAYAAPVTAGAIADRDLRRGQSAVPVMYDLRFAVGSAVPAAAGAQPIIDRAPPVMMPLVILPPLAIEAGSDAAPEADAPVAVAPAPQPAAMPEPPVVIDIPLPEPARVDLTLPPLSKAKSSAAAELSPPAVPRPVIDLPVPEPAPVDLTFATPAVPKEKPAVAAAEPQAGPQAPPRMFDIPMPEPATVDLTLPPAKPEPNADAAGQKHLETDARSKHVELAAIAIDAPAGTVKRPTGSIPLPPSKGAVHAAQAKTVPARPKPRRNVTRRTQRNDFASFFSFPTDRPQ